MPIYEYRCGSCGARVELFLKTTLETPACPECGHPLTERLLSAPNVSSGRITREPGHTCCGREERCDTPPCSSGDPCCRT